jgi:hypothetical protein
VAAWIGVEKGPMQFEVWQENWLIVEVFQAMDTQWRWTGGMQSFQAGLDLGTLPVVYEGLQVPRKRRAEVFQGLKVMERAALEVMHKA